MGRKKREEVPADDLDGTVEGQAAEFFDRQKAEYEEQTGERVKYEWGVPVTRTAIKEKTTPTAAESDVPADDEPAEGDS